MCQHVAWDYIFFLRKILGLSISQCEISFNCPPPTGAILTEQKMKAVLPPQQARMRCKVTPSVPCKLSTQPKASRSRVNGIPFHRPLTFSEHKHVWTHWWCWAAGGVSRHTLPITFLKAKAGFMGNCHL